MQRAWDRRARPGAVDQTAARVAAPQPAAAASRACRSQEQAAQLASRSRPGRFASQITEPTTSSDARGSAAATGCRPRAGRGRARPSDQERQPSHQHRASGADRRREAREPAPRRAAADAIAQPSSADQRSRPALRARSSRTPRSPAADAADPRHQAELGRAGQREQQLGIAIAASDHAPPARSGDRDPAHADASRRAGRAHARSSASVLEAVGEPHHRVDGARPRRRRRSPGSSASRLERLADADLVRAERAAARQHDRDALGTAGRAQLRPGCAGIEVAPGASLTCSRAARSAGDRSRRRSAARSPRRASCSICGGWPRKQPPQAPFMIGTTARPSREAWMRS